MRERLCSPMGLWVRWWWLMRGWVAGVAAPTAARPSCTAVLGPIPAGWVTACPRPVSLRRAHGRYSIRWVVCAGDRSRKG